MKRANRILVTALVLLTGVVAYTSVAADNSQYDWLAALILISSAILAAIGSYMKLQWRSQQKFVAKSVQASLLKHLWEERHKREW